MKIAIVDDEVRWQVAVKALIDKFPWTDMMSIECFSSGEEFCQADVFDIVFMDIEMTGMDGFAAAEKCREKNKEAIIVFLTTHIELSRRGYLVNAFRYIDKGNIGEELQEALESIANLCEKMQKLTFHMLRTGDFSIYVRDILYIETEKRNVVIHTMDEEFICNRGMDELEEELRDCWFFRCHKSYLVNLENIQAFDKRDVYFKNGKKAMISVRKYPELKQKHIEYKFRYANS